MTRPTVNVGAAAAEHAKTPTQKLVEDANRIVHVTDARGRTIGVRRLSMSIIRRIDKVFPVELLGRASYMAEVRTAACVVTVDGHNVDVFESGFSEVVCDSLIDKLDLDGFKAVGQALAELNPSVEDEDGLKN